LNSFNPGNYSFSFKERVLVFSGLFLIVLFQVLILEATSKNIFILAINFFLFSLILFKVSIKDFPTFLLFLTMFPLVYIDKTFSRYYTYIVAQNIPLYVLFLLGIFEFLKSEKSYKSKLSPLLYPVIFYTGICVILLIVGIGKHADKWLLFQEAYQNFYFILTIPIAYLITKRRNYKFLFNVVVIVFLIISIEYIIFNFNSFYRVTTYHNHYLPFVLGILMSTILFEKKMSIKILSVVGVILLWWGSYASGTRTLLIANFLVTVVVLFFYLRNKKSSLYMLKTLVIVLIFLIPVVFSGKQKPVSRGSYNPSQRVESIATPLEDVSFVMRIEVVYTGIKKIIENPIVGRGFGYALDLKYLLKQSVIFPDNNYIYYMLKGGIFFLIVALWLFFSIIKYSYKIFKMTDDNYIKIMMLANVAGVIGIMFFGLLNANLVKFKLNILYALSIAYTDFEWRNLQKKNLSVKP